MGSELGILDVRAVEKLRLPPNEQMSQDKTFSTTPVCYLQKNVKD
jgi:hypothetical protein